MPARQRQRSETDRNGSCDESCRALVGSCAGDGHGRRGGPQHPKHARRHCEPCGRLEKKADFGAIGGCLHIRRAKVGTHHSRSGHTRADRSHDECSGMAGRVPNRSNDDSHRSGRNKDACNGERPHRWHRHRDSADHPCRSENPRCRTLFVDHCRQRCAKTNPGRSHQPDSHCLPTSSAASRGCHSDSLPCGLHCPTPWPHSSGRRACVRVVPHRSIVAR